MTITLPIEARDGKITGASLLSSGKIPAVVYGPKQPNVAVQVDRKTFEKVFKTAGEATIISLTGLATPIDVLVHSVDFNPIKGGIGHIDFYAMERGKEMKVDVPLAFVGESPLEKSGGMVNKVLHEVEVTCLPSALPSHIDVDVSGLVEFDQKIHISDLVVPKGVTIHAEADEVVAVAVEGGADETVEDVAESSAETVAAA